MEKEFFVKRDDKVEGPFKLTFLKQLAKQKKLKVTDEFSTASNGPWQEFEVFTKTFGKNKPNKQFIEITDYKILPPNKAKDQYGVRYWCPNCDVTVSLEESEIDTAYSCPSCQIPSRIDQIVLTQIAEFRDKKISAQMERELLLAERQIKREDRREGIKKAAEAGKNKVGSIRSATSSFVARALKETQQELDNAEIIQVSDLVFIGRDAKYSDWVAHDPSVSRRHCVVRSDSSGNISTIEDLKSRTGTRVNSERISSRVPFAVTSGDIIRVGPAEFEVVPEGLKVRSRTGHAHLQCTHLHRKVQTENGPKEILKDVTLDIPPGTFAVVIGPSGSGKSTLVDSLSGRIHPSQGTVAFNGEDLYSSYEAIKHQIITVPQRDILHEQLTLRETLQYTAQLRLPKDIKTSERLDIVNKVVSEVEMAERSDLPINKLSGGQIKRTSLANELLSNPSMLFIDEATSGLDENSDRDIMQMLGKLAKKGKTILCITHNLANVQDTASMVIVMANGGYLAFAGSPTEAIRWFNVSSLAEIYPRLKDKESKEWANNFLNSEYGEHLVALRQNKDQNKTKATIQRNKPTFFQYIGLAIRHSKTIFSRCFGLLGKSTELITVLIAQPLIVAGLLMLVFGTAPEKNASPIVILDILSPNGRSAVIGKILFLIGLSSFWFGCNNGAKEVVKERTIFNREKHAGLSSVGYLLAKTTFLGVITSLQITVLLFLSSFLCSYSIGFLGLSYLPCLLLSGLSGIGFGILISSTTSSNEAASTVVPLVIIPQVILSGGLTPLSGWAQRVSMLLSPSYWTYGSLTGSLYRTEAVWSNWEKSEFVMSAQQMPLFSLLALLIFSVVSLGLSALSLSDFSNKNSTTEKS